MDNSACIKCGRDARSGETFCDACLAEAEKYPVKPGVVVLLPRRDHQPAKSAPRRRYPVVSPEEQVKKLKKRVAALSIALALSLAAVGGLAWLTVTDYLEEQNDRLLPGQNYSSVSESTEKTE